MTGIRPSNSKSLSKLQKIESNDGVINHNKKIILKITKKNLFNSLF